jgi:hypothetical protein
MIKRTTAILLILLANIILMAHAFVPHHHHKSEVCIDNPYGHADSDSHKHSDIEKNNNHDGKNEKEYCVLKEFVAIPINRLIKEIKSFDYSDNHVLLDKFHSILLDNGLKAFVSLIKAKAYLPLNTSSYIHFLETSLGLRAPPSV